MGSCCRRREHVRGRLDLNFAGTNSAPVLRGKWSGEDPGRGPRIVDDIPRAGVGLNPVGCARGGHRAAESSQGSTRYRAYGKYPRECDRRFGRDGSCRRRLFCYPHQLERRSVSGSDSMAHALVCRRSVVIADEPNCLRSIRHPRISRGSGLGD